MVIVGTHIDKVKHFSKQKRAPYTKRIQELYSNRHWYPTIKAIEFVSCEVKYNKYNKYLKLLRDTLYDIASSMKMSVGKIQVIVMCKITQLLTQVEAKPRKIVDD